MVKELGGKDHTPEPADQRHGEECLLTYSPLAIYRPGLVDPHRGVDNDKRYDVQQTMGTASISVDR